MMTWLISVRILTDQAFLSEIFQVFVIAFVPKGTAIPQPPWGAELPTLGAADSGNVAPSSTIVGATTTIVGGSTPGTTPGTGPGASSVPVATDTTPSTTVAGATSTTGG